VNVRGIKVGVQQYLWIWLTPIFLFGGVLVWIATGSLVSSFYLLEPSYFGVFLRTISLPAFWLAAILAPILILGRGIVWKFIKRNLYPVDSTGSDLSAQCDIIHHPTRALIVIASANTCNSHLVTIIQLYNATYR
jgi:hypothetical protein